MGRIGTAAAVVLLATLLAACESSSDRWIGRHYSEVARGWGRPTDVRPDGRGGQVMVWASRGGSGGAWDATPPDGRNPDTAFDHRQTSYWSPESHGRSRNRVLYVNSDGYVYGADWNAR